MSTAEDILAGIEMRRKARAEAAKLARLEQEAIDMAAIEKLEETLGVEGFVFVRLNAHFPGLPVVAAARNAEASELKRYRQSVDVETKGQVTRVKNTTEAAETLARACLEYPDAETYTAMCAARGGLGAALGQEIVARASAKSDADAKS